MTGAIGSSSLTPENQQFAQVTPDGKLYIDGIEKKVKGPKAEVVSKKILTKIAQAVNTSKEQIPQSSQNFIIKIGNKAYKLQEDSTNTTTAIQPQIEALQKEIATLNDNPLYQLAVQIEDLHRSGYDVKVVRADQTLLNEMDKLTTKLKTLTDKLLKENITPVTTPPPLPKSPSPDKAPDPLRDITDSLLKQVQNASKALKSLKEYDNRKEAELILHNYTFPLDDSLYLDSKELSKTLIGYVRSSLYNPLTKEMDFSNKNVLSMIESPALLALLSDVIDVESESWLTHQLLYMNPIEVGHLLYANIFLRQEEQLDPHSIALAEGDAFEVDYSFDTKIKALRR